MSKLDLRHHLPVLKYYDRAVETWGSSGNSVTVSNNNIKADSVILIMPIGMPAGRWKIVCSAGSMLITSSDTEESDLTFRYVIL